MINSKTISGLINNELLFKSGVYLVLRVAGFILGYVFSWLTVHYYGEATYGYVTLAFTIMVISGVVTTLGFDITLTKYFAKKNSIKNHSSFYYTAALVSFVLSCLVGLVIYYFSQFIATFFFNKPDFAPYLKIVSITIPFWVLMQITSSVFRGLKNIFLFSIFNTFGRFFFSVLLLVAVLFLFRGNDQLAPLTSHLAGLLFLAFLAILLVIKKVKPIRISFNTTFKEFFKDAKQIYISAILVILLAWIDRVFLGVYVTEELIGVYDIALRIATLIVFSLDAVNSILTPKISRAFHDSDITLMQKEIDYISKVNLLVSSIVVVLVLLFNKYIFGMFGKGYLQGQTVLYIMCVAQMINSISGSVWSIMQMTGLQKLLTKILLLALLINLVLNLFLAKPYGTEGVAIATAASMVFWNFTCAYYIYKKLHIRSIYIPKFITRKHNNKSK